MTRSPSASARPDELALWARVQGGEKPRHAGAVLGIHPSRVRYLCEKWGRAGIYDWGVVHDLGWPTPDAMPPATS